MSKYGRKRGPYVLGDGSDVEGYAQETGTDIQPRQLTSRGSRRLWVKVTCRIRPMRIADPARMAHRHPFASSYCLTRRRTPAETSGRIGPWYAVQEGTAWGSHAWVAVVYCCIRTPKGWEVG